MQPAPLAMVRMQTTASLVQVESSSTLRLRLARRPALLELIFQVLHVRLVIHPASFALEQPQLTVPLVTMATSFQLGPV